MNKDIFLMRLEQLLYEIPREEREEAMDYYRSYFEDAGVENEAAVLEELESPQKIAESIKEALNSTGDMTGALKNPPQVRENQSRSQKDGYGSSQRNTQSSFSGEDFQKASRETSGTDYQKTSGTASYRRYDEYQDKRDRHIFGNGDRRTKLILFIIAAVFLLPVWGGIVSGVLGVIGAVIAVVTVLGIFTVAGVIVGIVCTVMSVIKMCTLSIASGLVLLGAGMLLVAGSGISIVLLLLICGRLLPWTVRQIVRLFHWVLQWGRSVA